MPRALIILCAVVLFLAGCTGPALPVLETRGDAHKEFTVAVVNLAEGEEAYYTLDGSSPDKNSTRYTEKGIPLAEGRNVDKVVKYDAQGRRSKICTATFTVAPRAPRLATPGGVYNRAFSAVIVNLEEGQAAYYTLDGSEPDQNSTRYTEAGIPLSEGRNLLKAIKYDKDGNASPVLTAEIVIEPEPEYSNRFAAAAKHGNSIYYVQAVPGELSPYMSILYSRLYRYNIADGARELVLDENVSRFLICDGVIYYEEVLYEDGPEYCLLHRVDLDGNNHRELLRYDSAYIDFPGIMVEQWIYYSCRVPAGGSWELCRINADTGEIQQIRDDVGGNVLLLDRDIYFAGNEAGIFRFNADTGRTEKISDDKAWRLMSFGSFIYYYDDYRTTSINRIRSDGADKATIPVTSSAYFAVAGDRIFHGNPVGIESCRSDGAEKTRLSNLVPDRMEYYRDKIYFYCFQAPSPILYSLDVDTGQVTELIKDGGELCFFDGEVYFVCTELGNDMAGLYKLTERA